MAACFWLWLIWLVVLINGISWGDPLPAAGWPRYRTWIHLVFMGILAFLIYRVCGSLAGNLVH